MDYYLYLWLVKKKMTDDLLGATVLQCQALSKVNSLSLCVFFNHSSPETIIVVDVIVIVFIKLH